MVCKPEVLAIIPARGGSQGVPRKNIRFLGGKPLISYTIEAAIKSDKVTRIVVSTDDEEIAKVALQLGTEVPFLRPANLARHDTPSFPVFQHMVNSLWESEQYIPDLVVALQPTSPLRSAEDIDKGIIKSIETGADIIISVCEAEHNPYWMKKLEGDKLLPFMQNDREYLRRQDLPSVYRLNGAVYVYRKEFFNESKQLAQADIRGFIMPQIRSVDIDTELDFIIAESLLEKYEKKLML